MKFRTPVEPPASMPSVDYRQRMMLFGSCFAASIGNRLTEAKFPCDVNPYGILYNPLSIAAAIEEIMTCKIYTGDDLYAHNGCWHSPMHHGDFSLPDREETLRGINTRIAKAHRNLPQTGRLLMTWGTAYIYEDRLTGHVVGNCHKLPENRFRRRRLEPDEIVERSKDTISRLLDLNAEMKVTVTVSPIRHVRDGMHANQLSKSALLLAADRLQTLYPDSISYFPAYEIVLDELRDYRFYAADMVHPSEVATGYVWECFCQACMDKETRDTMAEVMEVNRAMSHRPLRPESDQYRHFLEQTLSKIERLNEKYPYLDFEKEKELCRTRLNP